MPTKRKRSTNRPNGSAKSTKSENVMFRCSPAFLTTVMKLINGNEKQRGYVEEIGFGSFLSMADADVGNNKALTLWLVDKFNVDTEALEFDGGISIPVRPLVKSVLGIPSGPIQVVEGLDVDDALLHQFTCDGRVKVARDVADELCSITDKEPFCRAFVMLILAVYLAPGTALKVNRALLGAVKQVDKLKEMDWCNFVATYLCKGIKEFKESHSSFIYIKGCLHILSVIFVDFVKNAPFEIPVGFPRLGVITAEHFKWVVSSRFTSLKVRRPEESIYASVLDNMLKDNYVEDGYSVDSETNTDALADKFATTDTDQNYNKHPVSAELGTGITSPNTASLAIVKHVELDASPRSAENAGDWSAKKARVDRPSVGQAKRIGGVAALDISLLNCSLCCRPVKPPVFQCNGGHLACGRCLSEFPLEQSQTCEHGGDFSPCPAMDNIVSFAMVECSHVGCKTSLPYYELDDHENACPHAPCYCTEPACSFAGSPQALLGHLTVLHFVPMHKVRYGEVCQLRVSEPRLLLHGVEDDSAFLLTAGTLGAAIIVSAVCIRADASPSQPQYAVKLSAKGPPPPSSAAGSIQLELEVVTSSTRPGDIVVEELPSYMMVPPMYLVVSKDLTLDIRIDKM
ncbi:unnamed protein product [Alopecurus aequalis]